MVIYIGTSGWQYRDWRARFYPADLPLSRWLAYYARRFRTVEVNNTFYRLPAPETFARWAATTPPDFVFALKVSRFVTHMKRLAAPEEPVRHLLAAARPLGPKLGPLLLQLSPRQAADPGRLEAALAAFRAPLRVAVEPRHPSWFSEQVRRVLSRRGAALCLVDRGGSPAAPLWRTADWGYVRLHGGADRPPGCYGPAALDAWAERIRELYGAKVPVFVYFNNDVGCCAVRDAARLSCALARLGRRTTRAPEAGEVRVG